MTADDLGASNYQFSVDPDTTEELFSACFVAIECSPHFRRPITTFLVEDEKDPLKLCVRSVTCCGLAELFIMACNKYSFETILKTWMEGRIVARDLEKRGHNRKKKKKTPLAAHSTFAETWPWRHHEYS